MNFTNLSKHLDIDEMEVFYRIKRFEHEMYKLLVETESDQKRTETKLNKRDLDIITTIAKYCRDNKKLIENDSLLEIILLYYVIMEVLSDKHTTGTLENYFSIDKFTDILMQNMSFFSKPYTQFYQKERSII